MPPKVHILCTCRREELLPATLMAFKTIRTGFPMADIVVWINGADAVGFKQIEEEAFKVTNSVVIHKAIHHVWIEHLLATETEPFWICDTDVVFWESMERFDFGDAALAGRYVPQFFCRFVNAITRPRLHTCLLRFNPAKIKEGLSAYFGQFRDTPFNPRPNLVFPRFYPVRTGRLVKTYFEDTCCGLYQALGGHAFTDDENAAVDHLHHGTISDLVDPAYGPREAIRQQHFAIFDQPHLLKGAWRSDAEFYRRHQA